MGHLHVHPKISDAPSLIKKAMAITACVMLIEYYGGWFSNSLTLFSDATHMLTDIGSMLISLFALWVAKRPVTLKMSFGYQRAEILGALASGLFIWFIAGFLIYEAFHRLSFAPKVDGPIVFGVSTLGLFANLLSMRILKSAKEKNLNIHATYLHLLSDLINSIGAIIAGLVLWITDWRPIDPIITLFFSCLMLFSSWGLIKECIGVLMESTPHNLDPAEVKKTLEEIPTIKEVHDLHIWSISKQNFALSVHLISENTQEILQSVHEILQKKYSILHTTIQIEHPSYFQSKRCYDCSPLETEPTA